MMQSVNMVFSLTLFVKIIMILSIFFPNYYLFFLNYYTHHKNEKLFFWEWLWDYVVRMINCLFWMGASHTKHLKIKLKTLKIENNWHLWCFLFMKEVSINKPQGFFFFFFFGYLPKKGVDIEYKSKMIPGR